MIRVELKIPFTVTNPVELLCLLRHIRIQRRRLWRDSIKLEEQIMAGHNDAVTAAYTAIQADISILDAMIRRMWLSANRRLISR